MQRIWSARGLKPHLVETFKLSNDPQFVDKLVDVVGLYLNPPENARWCCAWTRSRVRHEALMKPCGMRGPPPVIAVTG